MKKLIRSNIDKLFAVVILLSMTVVAVGGVLGIVTMTQYNIYRDGGKYAWDTALELVTDENVEGIEQAYYSYLLDSNYNAKDPLPPIGNGYAPDGTPLVSAKVLERYAVENCNFAFKLKDKDGNLLWYNYNISDIKGAEVTSDGVPVSGTVSVQYAPIYGYSYYIKSYETDWRITEEELSVKGDSTEKVDITVEAYVLSKLNDGSWQARDSYSMCDWWINLAVRLRFVAFVVVAFAGIVMLALLGAFTISAGREDEKGNVIPSFLDRIPFDLVSIGAIGLVTVGAMCIRLSYVANPGIVMENAVTLVVSLLVMIILMYYLETVAVRIKIGRPLTNTVAYHVFVSLLRRSPKKVRKKYFSISDTSKLITYVAVFCTIGALVVAYFSYRYFIKGPDEMRFEYYLVLWVASRLIAVPLLVLFVNNFGRIKDAGKKMAQGDFDSEDISTQLSIRTMRSHGENLDHIRRDMSRAYEQEMKSERFRNELISNLSHDLRTPLTSMNSFVELLMADDLPEEKRREYLEVLGRQMEKLNMLTKNLMDISKFTTGGVTVKAEAVDVGVLVEQLLGEFDPAFESNKLTICFEKEDREFVIMADGELLCRVAANLMKNVEKYAMPSTRVYVRVRDDGTNTSVSIRNVSGTVPDVPADELVERLVRGDSSRHTEGSGLGLPIAKSLTELQGGVFNVELDGDIFTVTLTFPTVKQ